MHNGNKTAAREKLGVLGVSLNRGLERITVRITDKFAGEKVQAMLNLMVCSPRCWRVPSQKQRKKNTHTLNTHTILPALPLLGGFDRERNVPEKRNSGVPSCAFAPKMAPLNWVIFFSH
jgi:hypothetical protein